MGIGDDEANSVEAPADERPQELGPERLVLGGAAVHAHDLALASGAHAHRHHGRDRHHPVQLSDLVEAGIEPEVGVGAFDGSIAE